MHINGDMNISVVTDDKIYIRKYEKKNNYSEIFAWDSSTLEKLDGVIRINGYYNVL